MFVRVVLKRQKIKSHEELQHHQVCVQQRTQKEIIKAEKRIIIINVYFSVRHLNNHMKNK